MVPKCKILRIIPKIICFFAIFLASYNLIHLKTHDGWSNWSVCNSLLIKQTNQYKIYALPMPTLWILFHSIPLMFWLQQWQFCVSVSIITRYGKQARERASKSTKSFILHSLHASRSIYNIISLGAQRLSIKWTLIACFTSNWKFFKINAVPAAAH